MTSSKKLFSVGAPLVLLGLFPLCVVIFSSLGAAPAWAQNAATGVITGQVTDQTGGAIPGANVRLTEVSTNSTTNTSTNETGRFTFPTVSPGTYDLIVSKEGFAVTRMPAQKVEVGMSLTMNVSLELGQTTTIVEVSAAAGAELQTLNSTVGSTISGDALQY